MWWSHRSEIWQASRQHCCRCACQISEQSIKNLTPNLAVSRLRGVLVVRLQGTRQTARLTRNMLQHDLLQDNSVYIVDSYRVRFLYIIHVWIVSGAGNRQRKQLATACVALQFSLTNDQWRSVAFIHRRTISQLMSQKVFCMMSLIIIFFKLDPLLPVANELKLTLICETKMLANAIMMRNGDAIALMTDRIRNVITWKRNVKYNVML